MKNKIDTLEEAFMALQMGEEKGLHFFFDTLYAPLIIFSESITKNNSAAEEIVSEAFVKLWHNAASFNEPKYIKYFLYRIVRNASIDFLRRQKTALRVATDWEHDKSPFDKDALHSMIETETYHRLYLLINKLPFKCRQVFEMFYFQNKAIKEIALEMGTSVNTVKSQKQRALNILRENKQFLISCILAIITYAY